MKASIPSQQVRLKAVSWLGKLQYGFLERPGKPKPEKAVLASGQWTLTLRSENKTRLRLAKLLPLPPGRPTATPSKPAPPAPR